MDTTRFLLHARLDSAALSAWIEAGWVVPRLDSEAERFSEIDVARAQLIRDLKDDLGVNDEGITVILHLVDQIHGLRGTLRGLVATLDARRAGLPDGTVLGNPRPRRGSQPRGRRPRPKPVP